MHAEDFMPQCSNEHVTIERYEGETDWPYQLFTLTFRNTEGGYVPAEIKSEYNSQRLRFYEK